MEAKGALFVKYAGRAKEKLLQNLGKVDRTADEIFDEHLQNFNRQLNQAGKLQKEFNNYIRCIRAVQVASKSLTDAICEVYESHWSGHDAFIAQAAATEALWQDFSHKLGDQVLIPLNTYTAQFQEMKKKIEKRNRKLIDYDGQRHSFQNVQANASKRKDDVKLTKGREQLEEARRTYEILNTELHDELPALFDSRILFLVTNLQTLFASEQVFHSETAKIYSELEAIVDKLATDSQRGSYTIKKSQGNAITSSPVSSPSKALNNTNSSVVNNSYPKPITNGSSNANSPASTTSTPSSQPDESPQTPSPPQFHKLTNASDDNMKKSNNVSNDNEPSYQNTAAILAAENVANSKNSNITTTTTPPPSNKTDKDKDDLNSPNANNQSGSISPVSGTNDNNSSLQSQQDQQQPSSLSSNKSNNKAAPEYVNGNVEKDSKKMPAVVGATTTDLPPGVLYRVKATYSYVKEDGDELSFEVGDIIRVIEYDDPEDQEEGWLMGEKEGTIEKGLFPANFTRPI